MASDLATMPNTGIAVQACGDAHLLNFGLYATPERHLVFDLNDFDETLPAPWEWDLKRLAASLVVAGRSIGADAAATGAIVRASVVGYCATPARAGRPGDARRLVLENRCRRRQRRHRLEACADDRRQVHRQGEEPDEPAGARKADDDRRWTSA